MFTTKVITLSVKPIHIEYLRSIKKRLSKAGTISVITVSDIVSMLIDDMMTDRIYQAEILNKSIQEARQKDTDRRLKQKYIYNRRKKKGGRGGGDFLPIKINENKT